MGAGRTALASPQQERQVLTRKQLGGSSPHQVVPREAVQAPAWPGYQASATVFHQDVTEGLAKVCRPPGGHLESQERVCM